MHLTHLLRPRFAVALLRNVLLKIRYGRAIDFDLFRTYFAAGTKVVISGSGRITFAKKGKRIHLSEGCLIHASSGILAIGEGVFFNRNCTLVAHQQISIGADCMFGPGVCLFDSDHAFDRTDILFSEQGYRYAAVHLGQNVWVGAHSVVTRGTEIARNVVVGANSLVKGKLQGGYVYGGNPLRQIRQIGASSRPPAPNLRKGPHE
jgi:acetyltransferase-like isoleucine patch superfamily enzyme